MEMSEAGPGIYNEGYYVYISITTWTLPQNLLEIVEALSLKISLHWHLSNNHEDRPNQHENSFFSIHTYTYVQFEQLQKYIQNGNKIYKNWYTQKESLDTKLFGISRKQ